MAEKIQTIFTAKDQASSVFKGFGATVIGLNQGLELLGKAMRGIAAPFAAVIEEGRGFTKQMSAIRSITKITEADFKSLSDEAERIGKTTAFSSTEAAKAMETLSRTGQSVEQVMSTTAQAMSFAAAQAISLDDAANTTAVQMNIFAKDSLTAEQAVNTMNKGLGASAQNFEQLQGALKTAALGASSLGIPFGELNTIVGTFANVGLKGEMAGTAIKIALKQLAAPTADAQKALESYGITLAQINPANVKFKDIMQLMKEKQVSFSDTVRIFGGEVGPNLTKVVQGGAAAFDEMAKKMDTAKTASQSAADQLNNLDGDLKLLDSAMSGLKLTIFKSMDTALRGIVQVATSMVGVFERFVDNNSAGLTAAFDAVRTAVGYFLVGIGEILIAFGKFINMTGVQSFLGSVGDAFDSVHEAVSNFIKEFIRIVTENKIVQSAFKKLKPVIDTVYKVFGKLMGIAGKVATALLELATMALEPLMEALAPLVEAMADFALVVLDNLLKGLNWVSGAIDKFSVSNMITGFKDLKEWVDETLKTFRNFLETLGLIPKKIDNVNKAADTENLSSYGKYANNVAEGLKTLAKKSDETTTSTSKLSGMFGYAQTYAKALEDQLIKNPLVGALATTGDQAISTGTDIKSLGYWLIDTKTAAKDLEDQVNNTTAVISAISKTIDETANKLGIIKDQYDKFQPTSKGFTPNTSGATTGASNFAPIRDQYDLSNPVGESFEPNIFGKVLNERLGAIVDQFSMFLDPNRDWAPNTSGATLGASNFAPIRDQFSMFLDPNRDWAPNTSGATLGASNFAPIRDQFSMFLDPNRDWAPNTGPGAVAGGPGGTKDGKMSGLLIGALDSVMNGAFDSVMNYDYAGAFKGLFKGKDILDKEGTKIGEEDSAAMSAAKSLGGLVSSAAGSIFSVMSDAVMGNEDLQKVIKESMGKIAKIVGPIVKSLIPIISKLMGALEKIISAVAPIITMIIDAIGPVIDALITDVLPTLIDLIKELGPIIKEIMDIIVPILVELMPLIKAILEVIIELLPIVMLIVQFIKLFLPIIIVLIKVITYVVETIRDIIHFFGNVLPGIFKAILAAALVPLYVIWMVLKPILEKLRDFISAFYTALTTVLKPIFSAISTALEPLKSALEALKKMFQPLIDILEAVRKALSKGGGGISSIGDALKDPSGTVQRAAQDPAGTVKGWFGMAQGSTGLTQDQLLRLPGMEPNAGLVKAHVGESIGKATGGGVNVTINVQSINPREQSEEIRQLMEELFLTGRLRVS